MSARPFYGWIIAFCAMSVLLVTNGMIIGGIQAIVFASLAERFDLVTTDFVYARLIGDRKLVDGKTKTFDRIVIDQSESLDRWAELLSDLSEHVPRAAVGTECLSLASVSGWFHTPRRSAANSRKSLS